MGSNGLEAFFGNTASIRDCGQALQQVADGLNEAYSGLDGKVSELVPESWTGDAASNFQRYWQAQSTRSASVSRAATRMSTTMLTLATHLEAALGQFRAAEEAAASSGCYITPAFVVMPYHTDPSGWAAAGAVQAQVDAATLMAVRARAAAMGELTSGEDLGPSASTEEGNVIPVWGSIPAFPVHQQAIHHVLRNCVSERFRNVMAQAQRSVDQHQRNEDQYMHAMVGANQDRATTIQQSNEFVRQEFEAAIKARDAGQLDQAYDHLGRGMHTLQDATSPVHQGFQTWNADASLATQLGHGWQERRYPAPGTPSALSWRE